MSLAEPIPGVAYFRIGGQWVAPGRPSLSALDREYLVGGTYIPGPDTTGVYDLAALVLVSGAQTYSSSGTAANPIVVENRDFLGKVSITGKHIKFKNCRFRGPGSGQDPIVQCTNGNVEGLIFEDCEFYPSSLTTGTNCISGHHFTLRRCNLHHSVDGVGIINTTTPRVDVVIEQCWFHDFVFFSPDPFQDSNATHNDPIQWHGKPGLTVRFNRFDGFYAQDVGDSNEPSVDHYDPVEEEWVHDSGNPYYPNQQTTSGSILVNQHTGTPGDLIFEGNWTDGGGAGLVLSSADAMVAVGAVINNKWGRNFRNGPDFAVLAKSFQTFTLTGNVRWDDGTPFNVRKNG